MLPLLGGGGRAAVNTGTCTYQWKNCTTCMEFFIFLPNRSVGKGVGPFTLCVCVFVAGEGEGSIHFIHTIYI